MKERETNNSMENESKIDTIDEDLSINNTKVDDDNTAQAESANDTDHNDTNHNKHVMTLDDIDDKEPISDQQRIEDAFKNSPPDKCKRDNALDKKINNYGTGAAVVLFLVAIVISIFNMKSMRYPISFLFLGLGAAAMAATAFIRRRNNLKCGCSVCVTQAKTLFTTCILYGVLGLAGIIAGIVLTVIN